ncbi:MAG: tRNA (adenosine(37)-N6)-threonylcarbamoyltransferase complex dimerization subunit type 1 TsaB [Saprospiraceae bacterium]|nr:tRNA (adenosine(37)-N6)-threonylcarbamoyltransferase complex dimerization subunit type 1 TsaB [Saprospiraceae bacterium]
MALILHIETATEVCAVCLSEGGQLIQEVVNPTAYSHASALTIMIRDLMAACGKSLNSLDAVSLSNGPGSFTGLRVGAAVAKGICFALDKPLIAIDTLKSLAGAIALECEPGEWICPMIDARRMEVYLALYNPSVEEVWGNQAMIIDGTNFEAIYKHGHRIAFGGNGASKCSEVLPAERSRFLDIPCAARHLIPFAEAAFADAHFENLASYSPNYLKRPNITVSKKGNPL